MLNSVTPDPGVLEYLMLNYEDCEGMMLNPADGALISFRTDCCNRCEQLAELGGYCAHGDAWQCFFGETAMWQNWCKFWECDDETRPLRWAHP